MLRTLREGIDIGLPNVGVCVIFAAVFFEWEHPLTFVIPGILAVEVGLCRLASRYFRRGRKYFALHAEVEQFLTLVRQLNIAAMELKKHDSPENHEAFEEIYSAMQQEIERIADAAGKTENESPLTSSMSA